MLGNARRPPTSEPEASAAGVDVVIPSSAQHETCMQHSGLTAAGSSVCEAHRYIRLLCEACWYFTIYVKHKHVIQAHCSRQTTTNKTSAKQSTQPVTLPQGCHSFPAAVRWCTEDQPSSEPAEPETYSDLHIRTSLVSTYKVRRVCTTMAQTNRE